MLPTLIALLIVGIAALVIGLILWARYLDKKRRETLEAFANEIGLEFHGFGHDSLHRQLKAFSLFNSGHGRKMKNVIRGETEVATIALFDYQYTTGSGKHQHTHRQTVVAMESDQLRIPAFSLRPENMFDKIGSVLGFRDIDFGEHPEFSRMFVLKGENEEAIRRFFDVPMLEFFAARKGVAFEARAGIFIYYRGGRSAKVDSLRDFLGEGYSVYSAIVERFERP